MRKWNGYSGSEPTPRIDGIALVALLQESAWAESDFRKTLRHNTLRLNAGAVE
jgi:hypothetical protein